MRFLQPRIDAARAVLQSSERTPLVLVFLGLMLDNLLLTVVVPIVPDHLYHIEHTGLGSPNVTIDGEEEDPVAKARRLRDLISENSEIGILFASKSFVQLFVNPCVALICSRYGYVLPTRFGTLVLLLSALIFAFGSSYGALFTARAIQGIGSSSMIISGMGLISTNYPDEESRSKNMGVALSGIAAGVLVGYPFGSIMYDLGGKVSPFISIALLVIVLAGAQSVGFVDTKGHLAATQFDLSQRTLLKDPYILIISLGVCVSTSAMAILEPCLPLWLLETMDPRPWQLGMAFVPDSIGYFVGSSFFGVFALRRGRWRCSLNGMTAVGLSALLLPLASRMWHLIFPHFGIGIGIGVVDASLMPLLADLVDLRHRASYGSVFAIAQIAVCMAYSAGPFLGGIIAQSAGFPFLMRGVGVVNLLVAPLCLFLKRLPSGLEHQRLIEEPDANHLTSIRKLSSQFADL